MQAKQLATGEDDGGCYWLSLCGVVAPPILVVFIIVAALVTPGYSHISETVSQLGAQGRPHPEVMNTGFIMYGLLVNGFAYGLYRRLGQSSGARAAWILLTIYGVGGVNVRYFPGQLQAAGCGSHVRR